MMGKLDLQSLLTKVQTAAEFLQRAYEGALNFQVDFWEFAVPLRHLVEFGVEESSLRWLVMKGYAEHARELTTFRDVNRRFRLDLNLSFTPETSFVLTEAGAEFLRDEEQNPVPSFPFSTIPFPTSAAASDVVTLPHWDSDLRVLFVGERIVKQYRQPALNQEEVLAAFERARWTHIIDDPLPPDGDICPEIRLRDTIRRLNTSQTTHLLRFHGDGTGRRLSWEMIIPLTASGQRTRKAA